MENKGLRTPLLTPILMLAKSRRAIIAVITLVFGVLSLAVPGLHEVETEVLALVIAVGLTLIGGISWEDAAKAGKTAGADYANMNPGERLQFSIGVLLDELDKREELPVEGDENAILSEFAAAPAPAEDEPGPVEGVK